jgi:hypothetical protein
MSSAVTMPENTPAVPPATSASSFPGAAPKETIYLLNTLLPRNSGWDLLIAWDVNDKGQITGGGVHNGTRYAFRFNPPELVNSSSITPAKAK